MFEQHTYSVWGSYGGDMLGLGKKLTNTISYFLHGSNFWLRILPRFYKQAILLYTDSHGSPLVFCPSATLGSNTTGNLKMARSGNLMINRGVALDWLKDEKIIGEAHPNTNKCPEQGLTQGRPNPKTLDCPEGPSWWVAGRTQVLNEDLALTVFV